MGTKNKVTETTEKKAKLSAIAAAAAEINAKLTPDPLLDLTAGDKQLTKDLVEIIPSIQPDDDLTPATKKVLTGLGWGKKTEKKIEKVEAKPGKIISDGKGGQKKVTGKVKAEKVPRGLDPNAVITVLAKDNPRREGTHAHELFKLYKNGITVAKAIEKGLSAGNIKCDLSRGNIKLG